MLMPIIGENGTGTTAAKINKKSRTAGFEPTRAKPNGFQVHLRNHLDTSADIRKKFILLGRVRLT